MDFLVECAWPDDPPTAEPKMSPTELADLGSSWVLHVDGASNSQGSGAEMILVGPDNFYTEYALRFFFETPNNQAKYEALLTGLRLAV